MHPVPKKRTFPKCGIASLLLPFIGLAIAWSSFKFDDTIQNINVLTWWHAIAALWVFPLTVIAGAVLGIVSFLHERFRLIAILAVTLNVVPCVIVTIGLLR